MVAADRLLTLGVELAHSVPGNMDSVLEALGLDARWRCRWGNVLQMCRDTGGQSATVTLFILSFNVIPEDLLTKRWPQGVRVVVVLVTVTQRGHTLAGLRNETAYERHIRDAIFRANDRLAVDLMGDRIAG